MSGAVTGGLPPAAGTVSAPGQSVLRAELRCFLTFVRRQRLRPSEGQAGLEESPKALNFVQAQPCRVTLGRSLALSGSQFPLSSIGGILPICQRAREDPRRQRMLRKWKMLEFFPFCLSGGLGTSDGGGCEKGQSHRWGPEGGIHSPPAEMRWYHPSTEHCRLS